MSFTVSLQKNGSENNALFKNVTTVGNLQGTLRNNSSLMKPVIICAGSVDYYANINYMTIEIFKRKYFVNNIVSINRNMFEVHARCDVLSTYAYEILNNEAIINRQESQYNLYLNDGSIRAYQNPIVLTKSFPSGFNTTEFVLAVAGG